MSGEFLVPTGYVIKDYLDELNLNQKELAKRMGMSEKHISNLLNGKCKLTEEFAIKLEKIIHAVPASYWLNYEAKYQEYKARNILNEQYDQETLKELDKRFYFSTVFSNLNLSLVEQANEMLKLLKISSFEQFDDVYSYPQVEFMEDGGRKELIAVWLNLALEEVEIKNDDLSNIKFNKEKLIKALPNFKKLALNKDIMNGINSAGKLLNMLGIYFAWYEPIRNSKVRGALTTYKRNPTILLSGRFKSHDHVWFALMHEIGHLLYHYVPQETSISMETQNDDLKCLEKKEVEANTFARDFFIDPEDYEHFVNLKKFDKYSIEEFAKNQEILPGIVVGRLQREKYIPYNQMNFLKEYLK